MANYHLELKTTTKIKKENYLFYFYSGFSLVVRLWRSGYKPQCLRVEVGNFNKHTIFSFRDKLKPTGGTNAKCSQLLLFIFCFLALSACTDFYKDNTKEKFKKIKEKYFKEEETFELHKIGDTTKDYGYYITLSLYYKKHIPVEMKYLDKVKYMEIYYIDKKTDLSNLPKNIEGLKLDFMDNYCGFSHIDVSKLPNSIANIDITFGSKKYDSVDIDLSKLPKSIENINLHFRRNYKKLTINRDNSPTQKLDIDGLYADDVHIIKKTKIAYLSLAGPMKCLSCDKDDYAEIKRISVGRNGLKDNLLRIDTNCLNNTKKLDTYGYYYEEWFTEYLKKNNIDSTRRTDFFHFR